MSKCTRSRIVLNKTALFWHRNCNTRNNEDNKVGFFNRLHFWTSELMRKWKKLVLVSCWCDCPFHQMQTIVFSSFIEWTLLFWSILNRIDKVESAGGSIVGYKWNDKKKRLWLRGNVSFFLLLIKISNRGNKGLRWNCSWRCVNRLSFFFFRFIPSRVYRVRKKLTRFFSPLAAPSPSIVASSPLVLFFIPRLLLAAEARQRGHQPPHESPSGSPSLFFMQFR